MLRKCSALLCVLLCLLLCACGSNRQAAPTQASTDITTTVSPSAEAATTAAVSGTQPAASSATAPTATAAPTTAGTTAAAPQTTTARVQTTTAASTARPATTKPAATPHTTTTVRATTRAAATTAPTAAPRTTRPAPATTVPPATTAAPTAPAPQTLSCTVSIDCKTLLDHLDELESGKRALVPANGVLLAARSVTFTAGESVFDVLKRVCRANGLQMEFTMTPVYHSAYIEGIGNLYEFDGGPTSGWMYSVNGAYPNCGCSAYALQNGDVVCWRYTCALGADIGGRNEFQ